ncbi:MAG: exosortase A [Pseudomonadales bacterium]
MTTMISQSEYGSTAPNARTCVVLGVFFLLWVLVFREALSSAIRVWSVSDTFNHCFLVLPAAFYLIWHDRQQFLAEPPKPNYWVAIPFSLVLLIGLVGFAGDIQVVSHFSAFASLSLAIWLCVGNRVARKIWFPLLFILLSVPIGDELIPLFQNITADIALWLLGVTGIPVFRNGLYLDIPEGRFVVAEACSGIRFFIASVAFGAIYAHVSYRKFWRKMAFMLVAILLPIVANGLRVYGIILVGHISDMKYAQGADHLVYGWVFFSFIILLLVLVGERWRTPSDKTTAFSSDVVISSDWSTVRWAIPLSLVAVSCILMSVWKYSINTGLPHRLTSIKSDELVVQQATNEAEYSWMPIFEEADDILRTRLTDASNVDLYIAWYAYSNNSDKGELIAAGNRMFDPDRWSLLSSNGEEVSIGESDIHLSLLSLTASSQEKRLVAYWYELPSAQTSSEVVGKLVQAFDVIVGKPGGGAVVALSIEYIDDKTAAKEYLIEQIQENYRSVHDSLPFVGKRNLQ